MEDIAVSAEEAATLFNECYECVDGPFAMAVKCGGYATSYFQILGDYLRDRIFFPLNGQHGDEFLTHTGEDLRVFVEHLRIDNCPYVDRTHPGVEKVKGKFNIEDVPVHIRVEDTTYHFMLRIVESKDEYFDRKLRFVLFNFYDHQEENDGVTERWRPTSLDQISGAIIEVLKQVQEKYPLQALMTFSMGNITFDALKHLDPEEAEKILPKTLIINRGLSSIQKVSTLLPFPFSTLLHYCAWLTCLDGNPELELHHFFERLSNFNVECPKKYKVTQIEMRDDCYFSNTRGFDPDYHEKLSQFGVDSKRGTFFVPGIVPMAHHALPLHLIPAHSVAAVTENFDPIPKGETVADCLMRSLFPQKGEDMTIFVVGGNKDNRDTMVCSPTVSMILSFLRLIEMEEKDQLSSPG